MTWRFLAPRTLLLIPLMLGSGCMEYELSNPKDPEPSGEDLLSDSAEPEPADTGEAAEEEDSGMPSIEDLPDTGISPPDDTGGPPIDEPGLCEDPVLDTTVVVDESCESTPLFGTLTTRTEWAMTDFMEMWEYTEVLSSPVVGHLTDDNGDGVLDAGDIPDIVIVTDDGETGPPTQGVMRSISGDGSSVHWSFMHVDTEDGQVLVHRYAGLALGDIDDDGQPEIVTLVELIAAPDGGSGGDHEDPVDEDHPVGPPPPPTEHDEGGEEEPMGINMCYPAAFDAAGNLEWLATDAPFDCGGHTPAIADLDGDGDVEIVMGSVIIEGSDGSVVSIGDEGMGIYEIFEEMGAISIIVDLDGDGTQEIIAGRTLYGPDGGVLCSLADSEIDGYTAAADLNGDGLGEFIVVGNNRVVMADHSCSVLGEWEIEGTGSGGPPTIADFDADGQPEIGIASATHYAVYESDGSMLWSREVTDISSHTTGSTVFDFEGDGRPEVVYADEVALWILDGLTGDVRVMDTSHTSRTLHEYPVVVDVNGDGYPEIVVPNGGGHHGSERTGIYVLGSGDGSWLGGRQVWNQHAYNIVNINDDLSVPAIPESNWPLYNNFRSGDLNPVAGENAPDAVPVAAACLLECEDNRIIIGFRLGNAGTSTLRTDMITSVYAVDWPHDRQLTTLKASPPIAPGETAEMEVFSVPADQVGEGGIRIVVDDEYGISRVRECHEDNNSLVLPEAFCP
jgi:hypothetical protein